MYSWDALNVNAKQKNRLLNNTKRCLSPAFLLQQLGWKSLTQKLQRGPATWKDLLENAWNGIANSQTRRQSHYTRFPVLVWTITKLKRKSWKTKGELSEVCSHIVLECLYLARIGRPDILWSVNKLARSVTRWTQACDRRLARLISYIHYRSNYRQCCRVGNAAQHCRLGVISSFRFCKRS